MVSVSKDKFIRLLVCTSERVDQLGALVVAIAEKINKVNIAQSTMLRLEVARVHIGRLKLINIQNLIFF